MQLNYRHHLFLILFIFIASSFRLQAQNISGTVVERSSDGHEHSLPGANVFWIGTSTGTNSDSNGKFSLSPNGISDKRLIASFTGYRSDTITVTSSFALRFVLQPVLTLKEVQINDNLERMNAREPRKIETINSNELKKAACCNLGESFETNASVDVTLKDAVSGSKEIQVLGLSGSYTQVLTENAPLIRGLGLTYGLGGVPGTLIDAINIVKGPGSVVFGHESISGMVNLDLKDPMRSDRFFVNAYLNQFYRKEMNIQGVNHMNPHLSSLLAFHADNMNYIMDQNEDGFTDGPLTSNVSVLNKWKYIKNGLISQNTVKLMAEQRMAGQTHFDFQKDAADLSAYGQKLNTHRMEFYGRTGYVIPAEKYNSIGFQYAAVIHDQSGFYGLRSYTGRQEHVDLKVIHDIAYHRYMSLNSGLSFSHLYENENFAGFTPKRNENIPGVFLENTFQDKKIIALITGIRADYYNNVIVTPRANLKYSIEPKTDVRLSFGTGWKNASLLAENPGILASNRRIVISENLLSEKAINYGLNFNHSFTFDYRKGSVALDFYRTIFTNKIIPNYETDSGSSMVVFSNLSGNAYSENIQIEGEYELIKKLKVKAAYKFLNVHYTYASADISEILIPRHRVFTTLFYESFNRKWNMSGTYQWYGQKRLPNTSNNPVSIRQPDHSPAYAVLTAQILRVIHQTEWYVGCENIFNFRQMHPIIGAAQPYGKYFDTVGVWGPLEGRRFYAGIRFRIK